MGVTLFPFRTISEGQVEASDWLAKKSEIDVEHLSSALRHWDYSLNVLAKRTLTLGQHVLADICPTGSELKFIVRVLASTGASGRRGRVRECVFEVERTLKREGELVEIEFYLESYWLSQRLWLVTEVLLAEDRVNAQRGEARWQGSRLWGDVFDHDLEGDGARFPIEVRSFSNSASNISPWRLRWSPRDYDKPFGSALRLLLNQDCESFVSRIQSGDKELIMEVACGVVVQLVSAAVSDDDFAVSEYDDGTLGASISGWISLLSGGADINTIRQQLTVDPAGFFADVSAVAHSLGMDS